MSLLAKRYNEAVEVYRPANGSPFFMWRGRKYSVLQIINRWELQSGWWRGHQAKDQQFFKVTARRAREETVGIYELCYDQIAKQWRLMRAMD